MKNVSSCVWLTMFALLGPLVMPIQARNCPNIPKEMTEITVKSNQTILRTEPSSEINQGVSIEEGSKLKVIEHTPKQEQSEANTDYCWYLVSQIDDPETYYIADSDIQEFVSLKNESTESPSPISSPSPSSSESPIPTPTPSPSSNINIKRLESKLDRLSDDLSKVSESSNDKIDKIESKLSTISDNLTQLLATNNDLKFWLILAIVLILIGCLEGLLLLIISYLYFNIQRRLTKKVHEEILGIFDQKTQSLLAQISNQITSQGIFYNKNKERLLEIIERLIYIENLIYSPEISSILGSKLSKNEFNQADSSNISIFSNEFHQTNLKLLERRIEALESSTIIQQTNDLANTLDLPILLYLRKNGHASFQDLLNNVHGNEENLIERLTALQEEDLIQITDPSDFHNSNYSL